MSNEKNKLRELSKQVVLEINEIVHNKFNDFCKQNDIDPNDLVFYYSAVALSTTVTCLRTISNNVNVQIEELMVDYFNDMIKQINTAPYKKDVLYEHTKN